MSAIFLAVFAVAVVTLLFSFITMDDDLQKSASTFAKTRPIFLLVISIFSWVTSLALFTAPAYTTVTTTGVPLNCFYNTANILSGTLPSVQNCGTTNTTTVTSTNTPFASYQSYEYGAFASAMALLAIILLVIYILGYGLTEFKKTFADLSKQIFKRKR